jgi:hypothetical protein
VTASDLDLHRASTSGRERRPRGLETESLCGFADLRADVHPASTARSSASASRSETAYSWLSTARWPVKAVVLSDAGAELRERFATRLRSDAGPVASLQDEQLRSLRELLRLALGE